MLVNKKGIHVLKSVDVDKKINSIAQKIFSQVFQKKASGFFVNSCEQCKLERYLQPSLDGFIVEFKKYGTGETFTMEMWNFYHINDFSHEHNVLSDTKPHIFVLRGEHPTVGFSTFQTFGQ